MTELVVKVMTGIGVMRTLDTGGAGGVIGNADTTSGPEGLKNREIVHPHLEAGAQLLQYYLSL